MAISSPFPNGSGQYLYQNVGDEEKYLTKYNLGGSEVMGLSYNPYILSMTSYDFLEITLHTANWEMELGSCHLTQTQTHGVAVLFYARRRAQRIFC